MFKIAVLASTNGTDLQAIIDEMKAGKMPSIELAIVASNKQNCYALERAKEQGLRLRSSIQRKNCEEFDKMAAVLEKEQIELVVLVGYMRILSTNLYANLKPHNKCTPS
jgi:phosphoribosylglycinamide formyltransferase-1